MSHDGLAKLSFTLPNGVIISACNVSDSDWESIGITAAFPDGLDEIMCLVDYTKKDNKLRIFAYDRNQDEPVYSQYDYFALNESSIQEITTQIVDLQSMLENKLYTDAAHEKTLVCLRDRLRRDLQLAGVREEEIP